MEPEPEPEQTNLALAEAADASGPKRSPHGEVRDKIYRVLPSHGEPGMTTKDIYSELTSDGYVFLSKHPIMAINDALWGLTQEGKAVIALKRGVMNYWTRGTRMVKSQDAQDQQHSPP